MWLNFVDTLHMLYMYVAIAFLSILHLYDSAFYLAIYDSMMQLRVPMTGTIYFRPVNPKTLVHTD